MALRDWIHPGWFAPYDWWRARRNESELDDELDRRAHPERYFGLAELHRPGAIIPVGPNMTALMAHSEARVEIERFERRAVMTTEPGLATPTDEQLHLAAIEEARAERNWQQTVARGETMVYNGPRDHPQASRMSAGDEWVDLYGDTYRVTRVEDGSWILHGNPSEDECRRIWALAMRRAPRPTRLSG